MRLLFVGDIFGQPGRMVASEAIPRYIRQKKVDVCVVNGENAAGGFGLTHNIAGKIFSYGVDVITSGNHIWDRKETESLLITNEQVLRPANYPEGVVGSGDVIIEVGDGRRVGVINLQGRIFMPPLDCPFKTAERIVKRMRSKTPIIMVDIHAEATSEKMALGWFLDGKVSAVLGTHTHVMTADERILPGGTAFISDVGMTGPHDSIIGVNVDQSLKRVMKQIPVRFSPAEGGLRFSAVLIDIDDDTGKATSIKRIFERIDES